MAEAIEGEIRSQVLVALKRVRQAIQWKSGKDVIHLRTRQAYGHLPPAATLNDYEAIIKCFVR